VPFHRKGFEEREREKDDLKKDARERKVFMRSVSSLSMHKHMKLTIQYTLILRPAMGHIVFGGKAYI